VCVSGTSGCRCYVDVALARRVSRVAAAGRGDSGCLHCDEGAGLL
jgi:hypothetical protein